MITLYSSGPMFGLPHPSIRRHLETKHKIDYSGGYDAEMLKAQGLGRHTAPERLELGKGDVNSVVTLLGNTTYLLGDKICGADASVFGSLFSASSSYFDTKLGAYIRSQPKIMAYLERMRTRFFPEGSDGKA